MFRLDRKVTFWRVGGNHTVCLQVMIIMVMLMVMIMMVMIAMMIILVIIVNKMMVIMLVMMIAKSLSGESARVAIISHFLVTLGMVMLITIMVIMYKTDLSFQNQLPAWPRQEHIGDGHCLHCQGLFYSYLFSFNVFCS